MKIGAKDNEFDRIKFLQKIARSVAKLQNVRRSAHPTFWPSSGAEVCKIVAFGKCYKMSSSIWLQSRPRYSGERACQRLGVLNRRSTKFEPIDRERRNTLENFGPRSPIFSPTAKRRRDAEWKGGTFPRQPLEAREHRLILMINQRGIRLTRSVWRNS